MQLRSAILVLASVALRKIPASTSVEEAFKKSRKKKLLKEHFSSWAKVKRLLRTRDRALWERVLSDLAPSLGHATSAFFRHGEGPGE